MIDLRYEARPDPECEVCGDTGEHFPYTGMLTPAPCPCIQHHAIFTVDEQEEVREAVERLANAKVYEIDLQRFQKDGIGVWVEITHRTLTIQTSAEHPWLEWLPYILIAVAAAGVNAIGKSTQECFDPLGIALAIDCQGEGCEGGKIKSSYIEAYQGCGCSSEERYKKDLLGYCGQHGGSRNEVYGIPAMPCPCCKGAGMVGTGGEYNSE